MFAEQPKYDLFHMLDKLSLYQGLLSNFPDIIHLQKETLEDNRHIMAPMVTFSITNGRFRFVAHGGFVALLAAGRGSHQITKPSGIRWSAAKRAECWDPRRFLSIAVYHHSSGHTGVEIVASRQALRSPVGMGQNRRPRPHVQGVLTVSEIPGVDLEMGVVYMQRQ
ncbi:hypothetical protein Z043_100626 [Scleropages formosus]|uniref:Sorting nexin protein WASP-binding domain-containing protein n=1 Tax=Scleropages formosus TaxID=113540 RepID=A0A0P7ZF92_SCLFO|nr:hypothetical protein Z043_100626 [Scleropages formosus]